MSQNFIAVDREQVFLLAPDVRDWLPEGHLAWFVLDAVAGMDLSVFYAAYRRDGWGRPAYDPAMMVALLLYAYARAERSSRGIERRCGEDVAYRVITANQVPDHATIARFRRDHEDAIADLFTEVLALCAKAGLVNVGVIAVDGTKLHANASDRSNLTYEQIARELLEQAEEIDRAEDERFAGMSYRPSCVSAVIAANASRPHGGYSTTSAKPKLRRCRASGSRGWSRGSVVCARSGNSTGVSTPSMSAGVPAASAPMGGGWEDGTPTPTSSQRARKGSPTPPTLDRAR
jgi:transposase